MAPATPGYLIFLLLATTVRELYPLNSCYTFLYLFYNIAVNLCALNCYPDGENFYTTFTQSVQDGTPCSWDKRNPGVCVDGKCWVCNNSPKRIHQTLASNVFTVY
jgi:hypothetical protein